MMMMDGRTKTRSVEAADAEALEAAGLVAGTDEANFAKPIFGGRALVVCVIAYVQREGLVSKKKGVCPKNRAHVQKEGLMSKKKGSCPKGGLMSKRESL